MPEVTRELRIEFSRAEIREILSERAKELVLSKQDVKCVELDRVEDVEGGATVVLYVGNKPIETSDRDRLLNARQELIDHLANDKRPDLYGRLRTLPTKLTDAQILKGIREINDSLDGTKPYDEKTKLMRLR